jgi:acetyltransferase-like isoleucine patch superfamily enzyme
MFLPCYRLWLRFCARFFSLLSRGAFHDFGAKSLLSPPIRIAGEEHISIGREVFIGPHCWLQVIDSDHPQTSPIIRIGDQSAFSGFCTITAVKSVIIEAKVLIARYVHISDHSHAFTSSDLAIKDQGISKVLPVRISEGAWIGQGAVICPGVTIGRNAVIGANSVVRSDVPDFCVAVGAPAKVIRRTHPSGTAGTNPARAPIELFS